jgi:hypothetical protein
VVKFVNDIQYIPPTLAADQDCEQMLPGSHLSLTNSWHSYVRCKVRVMSASPQRRRLLLGFEAADWLFLAAGIALAAVIAAVLAF